MPILKEFFCPGHGPFEAYEPRCPRGCTIDSDRDFRTAPAIHDGNTRRVDDLVRSQVEAMGLTNIRTNLREGDTAKIQSPAFAQAQAHQDAIRKKFPSPWGQVPKAGVFKAGLGPEGEVAGGGAVGAIAAHGAQPADTTAPLRGAKFRYEAVRDPDALKVDVSKAA